MSLRGLWLFALPLPLFPGFFIQLLTGDGVGAAANLVAFAALMSGAWLHREGERAAMLFEQRTIARPPRAPRKTIAAALTAAGVGIACLGSGFGAAGALALALVAGVAQMLAFGVDPFRAKGGVGAHVTGTLEQARAAIAEIEGLARGLRDRTVEQRLGALLDEARGILGQIEADPRDLPRARRYLTVYLTGARDAAARYARSAGQEDDPAMRSAFLELLSDLRDRFATGREALLVEDRSRLEVEIEVLKERLARDA